MKIRIINVEFWRRFACIDIFSKWNDASQVDIPLLFMQQIFASFVHILSTRVVVYGHQSLRTAPYICALILIVMAIFMAVFMATSEAERNDPGQNRSLKLSGVFVMSCRTNTPYSQLRQTTHNSPTSSVVFKIEYAQLV